MKKGLYKAKWPCRLELIHNDPGIYVDGAHNADGVKVMVDFFKTKSEFKKVTFIFGVLKDKEYEKMAENIAPIAEKVYTVTPENERALPAHELAGVLKRYNIEAYACDSIEEAVNECIGNIDIEDNSRAAGDICIFGSLYFVGYAKNVVLQNFPLKLL